MGRYYKGDIEGKFWFGVQSSNDADYFGVIGLTPSRLGYSFDSSDIDKVNTGIENCFVELGSYKQKLDEFFNANQGYNNEMLAKYLEVSIDKIDNLLVWYARLDLGIKIRDCINKKGWCTFEAEL